MDNFTASDSDPRPPGVELYDDQENVPKHLVKYWRQRYMLFSNFDFGYWMTEKAWYGVTPEPVARRIARDLEASTRAHQCCIVDIFAGVGGNAIAFAESNKWAVVIAIEKEPAEFACLEHNVKLANLEGRVLCIFGDCFEVLQTSPIFIEPHYRDYIDASRLVIFASPPWGGVLYNECAIFDTSAMEPYSLSFLHRTLYPKCSWLALYLPRNSDIRQLAELATGADKVTVRHYCINGASKAICAYYPASAELKEE